LFELQIIKQKNSNDKALTNKAGWTKNSQSCSLPRPAYFNWLPNSY